MIRFLCLGVILFSTVSPSAETVYLGDIPDPSKVTLEVPSFPIDRSKFTENSKTIVRDMRKMIDDMLLNPAWQEKDCPQTQHIAEGILQKLVSSAHLEKYIAAQEQELKLIVGCKSKLLATSLFEAPTKMAAGYITISGAFFKFYKSTDEVAFVMSHELAHFLLGHDLSVWEPISDDPEVLASLGKLYAVGMEKKKLEERDADMLGLFLTQNAGFDPNAAVDAYSKAYDKFGNWGTDPTHFEHRYLVENLKAAIIANNYNTKSRTSFSKEQQSFFKKELKKAKIK